jgi:hypothetical protein
MILKKLTQTIVVLIITLPSFIFAQQWQTQAPITVTKSGIVEVLLLPELHNQLHDGLDLKVMGTDGNPRPFELFWREDAGAASLRLARESARLEDKLFIWSAKIKESERFNIQSLRISVLAQDSIGKVDIYGLKKGAWIKLADKAAIFTADGTAQGEIKIKEDIYEGFRLEFTAYAKKPVPIGSVEALGEKQGKD